MSPRLQEGSSAACSRPAPPSEVPGPGQRRGEAGEGIQVLRRAYPSWLNLVRASLGPRTRLLLGITQIVYRSGDAQLRPSLGTRLLAQLRAFGPACAAGYRPARSALNLRQLGGSAAAWHATTNRCGVHAYGSAPRRRSPNPARSRLRSANPHEDSAGTGTAPFGAAAAVTVNWMASALLQPSLSPAITVML